MAAFRQEQAAAFRALHVAGAPLILFNVWDAGSAKAVAAAGARALATGSWSVAAANGFPDGEQMPRDLALENLARIVDAVDLPVSIDLEGGYGAVPGEVAATVALAAEAGAIGCNLEDGIVGGSGLHGIDAQFARIAAARQASAGFFVNARIDLFLGVPPADQDEALLAAAIERALAYVEAGADGVFVPGLADERQIVAFCSAVPRPVNVMASPDGPPPSRLALMGAARISYGPGPYRLAMKALEEAARAALA